MLFTAHTDKVNCRDITKNYYQDMYGRKQPFNHKGINDTVVMIIMNKSVNSSFTV